MHKSVNKYVNQKHCDYYGDGIANGERATKFWKQKRVKMQRFRLKRLLEKDLY